MLIADLQDRAEALGRPGGIANFAEAAPGVERSEAPTVSHGEGSLYAARTKIYPKRAHGTFRTIKWIVMAVTLSIYYAVPWIRWDRGPYLPDQAVLIDFSSRRFFFFFLEIWPQEFYYITGLLVLAALGLFLVTSIAGRMWCGYTCPQTVWTDLMIAVERFFQGDRNSAHAPRQGALVVRDAVAQERHASGLAADRDGDRRRLGVLFRRRADACAPARHFRRANAGLRLRRHLHRHHLRAGRHRPRAGLHLYVPVAAHPGRHDRSRFALDFLSGLARRAAWRAQSGAILGGQGRLHRLPAMRGGVPDRHRHPPRLAARMHPMRTVHRRLQRDHGQGRQAALGWSPTTRSAIWSTQARRSFRFLVQAPRRALRHGDGDCRRDHADGADASARTGGERAARPQSALRQAFRRWIAQRLHRENSQQALSAAFVQDSA